MNPKDNKPQIYLREVERRMPNALLRKGLVVGIIILFFGTSILPSIGKNIEIDNKEINGKSITGKGTSFDVQLNNPRGDGGVTLNLTQGLVGYWNLNEGSGSIAHDSSGNGYDGTISGASWINGISGSALQITGTNIVGGISSSFDDSITTAITVSAWVKWYGPSTYPHDSFIFDCRSTSPQGFAFAIQRANGKLLFHMNQGNSSFITSVSSVPSNGSWTHVAIVFDDANDILRLYINGIQDNTKGTTAHYQNSNANAAIGNNHWAPGDGQWAPLNGIEDEVRIYNRALNASEIEYLYENPGGTGGNANAIFFDDFNDNIKDYSRWTEIYTNGTWQEINQRAEFQCYESGNSSNRYEGIQSSAFTVSLSPTKGANISWDMITKIAGTTSSVGQPRVRVTDGNNWIEATYDRWNYKTKYRDSTYPPGEIWTTLENGKSDGSWSNKIKIFSDRYYVTMDSVGSGSVNHTIFSSNPTLKVQIFIVIGGSTSNFYLRSGFDNVLVENISGGNQPPHADAGGPYYGTPGNPIYFNGNNSYDNNNNGSIIRYDWMFFQGDTWHNNTGPQPTYIYNNIGNYTATLRVFNNLNMSATDNASVLVNNQPYPPTAEAGGPYYGIQNESVQFDGSGSHDNDNNETIIQYDWKFYTGDVWHDDLGATPIHLYLTGGNYTVELRVHNDEGFTDTDTAPVGVYAYSPPSANTGGPYDSMQGSSIQFNGSGSHDNEGGEQNLVRYDWQFYNGDLWHNDTGPKPTFTYQNEGNYSVSLRVWDDEGNTGIANTIAHVEGYHPPTAVPGGPYYGITNVPVQFNGSASHDNDQGGYCIVQYDWKFYAGDTWHINIGPTPTHTYTSDNTYTVSLCVHDNEGVTDTENTTATTTTYYDPTAEAGGPYSGVVYSPVTFDASASHDNDQGGYCIVGYRWDWTNDGTYDTGWLTTSTTSHTYNSAFTGLVKLQVKDNEGSTAVDTAAVSIQGRPPTANFQAQSQNNPSIFTFDGSTSIDSRPGHSYHDLFYRWDFNNDGIWEKTGSYSSAGIVTWSYSTSGQKTIVLKVENPDGSGTVSKTITAFVYNDINVRCSNKDFFLSWPGSGLPPLKNKYFLTTPTGIFDKVEFKIGSDTYIDSSGGPNWVGILKMSEGNPGNSVTINGYKNNQIVWTKQIPANIISTPQWFINFLKRSSISVFNDPLYLFWKLTVIPALAGLTWESPKIPDKFIGGKFGVDTSLNMVNKFTISSSESFVIIKPIAQGSGSFKLKLADRDCKIGGYGFGAGMGVSANIGAAINPSQVYLSGDFTVNCFGEISYDIPFIELVVFDAGASFTFGGKLSTSFRVTKFANDGFTLSKDTGNVGIGLYGSGSIYAQIVLGLGRVEGGLTGSGDFTLFYPNLNKELDFQLGLYAKASVLWGIQVWRGDFTLVNKKWTFSKDLSNNITNTNNTNKYSTKKMNMRDMDIISLYNFNNSSPKKLGENGLTVLSQNVGELAVPRIIFTRSGKGIAVWSDIKPSEDGFQSDIYWSIYNGYNWGPVEGTNTNHRCEFDPKLVLVKKGTVDSVVLTYLAVDQIINETTDSNMFYASSRIQTAVWNETDGWSFAGENLLISDGTAKIRSMTSDSSGNVFMSYLVDSECDPWENGICKLYVVNGTIGESIDGKNIVNWSNPVFVRELDNLTTNCYLNIAFINKSIGSIVYERLNTTSGLNETVLIPTVSGIQGFSNSEIIVNQSNQSIGYVSSNGIDKNISVFSIKNHSQICENIINTNSILANWVIGSTQLIYSNLSIVSLKPISVGNKSFLLFQMDEKFIPFILQEQTNGSWGNVRQISRENWYSLGQVDGDSNANQSQMIYLRDTPLINWLVGQWRFNEGNGSNVSDSSTHRNNGDIIGNASWVEHINESLDSMYGYYLCFNGPGDYVEIPSNTSLTFVNEFTSTCWVKLNQKSTGNILMGINGSWLLREVNGQIQVNLWRSNGETVQSGIADLPIGVWTFICVIYDHNNLRVSVRPTGLENTSVEYDLGNYSLVASSSPLILGGFMGCMDEVWLFNKDISMSEVDSIWFTPYPVLGSIHDVVVQPIPSFASFSISSSNYSGGNVTTEDIIQFSGSPSGLNFEWNFGDGTTAQGNVVSHQYTTAGFYTVVCNATDPVTDAVTPLIQTLSVRDTTPPTFAGLASVSNGGDCNAILSWSQAVDNGPYVLYYGFMCNASGAFNFSQAQFITQNLTYTVNNLTSGMTYFFIVRAVDTSGNMEQNTVERYITISDTTPPVFAGLTNVYNLSSENGTAFLEWDEAADPSPPIMYDIYMAIIPGGENYNHPVLSTNYSWAEVSGLNSMNKQYYFVVRARDSWGNEDNNSVEMNISFKDTIAPVIIDHTYSNGSAGHSFMFNTTVIDAGGVASVGVEYWYGTENHTITNMTLGLDGYWWRIIAVEETLETMQYYIFANDTTNNQNWTSIKNVTIVDNDKPEITNIQAFPTVPVVGGYVNISAVVTDNIAVNQVFLIINYPNNVMISYSSKRSNIENFSITQNKTDDTYYCNKSYDQLGIYTYHIWANDTSGNVNRSTDYTFEILDQPPYIPSNPNPANGTVNISVNASLSWTGGDPDPSDTITYDVYFGTSSTPPQVSSNLTGNLYDPSGLNYSTTYYWRIVAWDNHGASTPGPVWHFTTILDTTPPVTTISFNGTMGNHGWYVSPVSVSFNATDSQSGVTSIYYKIDGGGWTTYTSPLAISSDGNYTISYYSIDKVGNVETPKNATLKIDGTPPTITLTKQQIDLIDIKFTAQVNDNTSGIDRVEFFLDGALQSNDTQSPYEWTWTGLGNHQVIATVYDLAGNSKSQSMSTPLAQVQGMNAGQMQISQQQWMNIILNKQGCS